MVSILLSILVIGMAALNLQLIKRIDGDVGKIEDHDDEEEEDETSIQEEPFQDE